MANTIALNEDAKVKFKVGYEKTLLDSASKIFSARNPGTIYFAIKEDTVDPTKGLVGSIYYDIDDETRIKMTSDGYAIIDVLNQDIISTYIKEVSQKDDKVTILVKKGDNTPSEFRLNFVDRAGDTMTGGLTIGGLLTGNGGAYFNTNSGTKPLIIGRTATKDREQTSLYHTDNGLVFDLINDEATTSILFNMSATDIETNAGAGANSGVVRFDLSKGKTTVTANNFSGLASHATKDSLDQTIATTYIKNAAYTNTIDSGKFTFTRGDNTPFEVALPLATASVAGLVSGKAQTFAGAKTFNDTIYPKRGILFGSAGGTANATGWVNFLDITVSASYKNTPIELELYSRNRETGHVTLVFNNVASTTPGVKTLVYYGGNYDIRVVASGSTYHLYYAKSESYDNMAYTVNTNWDYVGTGLTFKAVNVHSSTDPEGTKATFKLEASLANKANQDGSGQNINSTYIKKLNYYLASGDTKPSDYRSATHNMITSTLGNNSAGSWVKLIGADETYAGLLTAAAQTIGGEKTFAAKAYFNKDVQFKANVDIDKTLNVDGATTLTTLQTTGDVKVGTAGSGVGALNVAGGTTLEGTLVGTTATFKSGSISNVIDSNGYTTNGWFNSKGNTGWRNTDHGGGWYMSDSSWIRSYGSKNIYHNTGILRTDGTLQVGADGARFQVNASNIFLNLHTILKSSTSIIQYQNATSNWTQAIQWWTGGVAPTKKYAPGIAQHNTGGTSTNPGVITIVPHQTDTSPWGRSEGLSIAYNDLRFEGRRIVTSTLNTQIGGPEKAVYVSATGQVTAITKSFGANDTLFYVKDGTFTTSTANVGTSKKPIYMANGKFIQCDDNIDNNAASASTVYTNVDSSKKYYLAGTQLTASGNSALYQDNSVYVAVEAGHLAASKISLGAAGDDTLITSKGAVLYAKGNAFITGNITLKGDIRYEGTKNTYSMIRFIDNTADANGNGISIGGGGFAVLGSGESASNLVSWLAPSGGTERTFIVSDQDIVFFSNLQTASNYTNNYGIQLTGVTFRPLVDKLGSLGDSSHRWSSFYTYNGQINYANVVNNLKVGSYTNDDGSNIDTDRASYYIATQGIIVNDWVRTRGNTGWYNETHQGGWYMIDDFWVRNYQKRVFISGAATKATLSTAANPGSQLVLGSTTSDSAAGGDVALEFFRGSNASWKIVNSSGNLFFLHNYTTAKQSSYAYQSLKLAYNTGAGSIPYLAINTDCRTDYRLYVNGTSFLNGNTIINGTLRTYNNITVQKNDSTDVSENYVRAVNKNGSIELLTSTNRGLYDRTNSKWVIGTNTTYGPWTPGTFAVGAASSSTTTAYTFYVNGTANISSNFRVGGNTTLVGTLTVNNATTFNGNVTVGTGKTTTLGGTLSVADTATFKADSTFEKQLIVNGLATLKAGLNLTGNLVLTGNLEVTGTSKLTKDVTMGANATVGGTLGVTGATTLNSSLNVVGVTTLTGALNANGATTVNATFTVGNGKASTLGGTLSVTGNTTIGGTLKVTGATTLSNTLTVAGATTLNGTLTANKAVAVNNTFTVGNYATKLGGTLAVTGVTTLSSNLTVGGTTTLNSSLTVAGATTLNGKLDANKAVSVNNTLTVGTGYATKLGGTLAVTGAATLSSTLNVSGLITGTRLHLTTTTDLAATSNNDVALIIGSRSGQHLAFDNNEIMSKGSGTAAAALYLNNEGGAVYARNRLVVTGASVGGPNIPVYIDANGYVQQCTGGGANLAGYVRKSGDTMSSGTAQIQRAGSSVSWYQGRSNAFLRINSYSGYNALYSIKTTNGDWSCGVYSNNTLYWTYVTDTNFNAGTNTTTAQMYLNASGYLYAPRVYNAVWNDYAEFRKADTEEAGRVVIEGAFGVMAKSTKRLQPGASIISDTYGHAMGETDECKAPIAVAGRVLAYPYEDRQSYPLGAAVCSGPDGTVSLMTREEIREYPERIIGTVSEIPDYEEWGQEKVKVNGRVWIKVK